LKRLLAIAPEAHFNVIESSAEVIALARARIGHAARVRFHCQDALAVSFPRASYDGVVTCSFWIASRIPNCEAYSRESSLRSSPGQSGC